MTAPMRVAHVVGTAGSTGVESHLLALLPSFDPAEVAVTLFVPGPGLLVDRLRERGVAVEFGAPTRKLALFEANRLAGRWRGAFDVVHSHGPRVSFWSAYAARRARVHAFVITQHENRRQSLPPGWKRTLWLALEERALRSADAILPVSEFIAGELRRVPGLAEKIRVVHGTAPMLLDARLPRARARATPGEPLRLVTVGRFSFEKGYDRLFESLALLARRGVDLRLDVIGHGELGDSLRRLARERGLESRVHWSEGGASLPATLAGAHLYVTGTRNEGLSVAGLEAMAVGLPIVSPNVGGQRELIDDGVTGVLVSAHPESEVPRRLADAIERLANDPVLAARMGESAARRAREEFAPARMAREVTVCYRALLARPAH